ncbi:uncharacterized protein B0I36DRAFT_367812 [Microdochium trichocladiopsis]|uniref:Uncharacterized protein n=1 Tax=Microdochium trichocladiopsis TaxID=1682393 RepID=A0A9P8XWU3_9PEZI|nr:uncharacterized protein B0I36DRAFT_367812 [Microdochium trichocladiopsis]KAH7021397.1 hypothetical protein B0I36DRAFT_367812 [Microdochium trichocladiopsis]
MFTKSFFMVLAATSALAAPAPAAGEGVNLVPRALLFKICRQTSFRDCYDSPSNLGRCTNAYEGWNDAISSAKTTDPSIQCYIWTNYDCGGTRGGPIGSDDGHIDLGDFGWNDKISSWMCQTR